MIQKVRAIQIKSKVCVLHYERFRNTRRIIGQLDFDQRRKQAEFYDGYLTDHTHAILTYKMRSKLIENNKSLCINSINYERKQGGTGPFKTTLNICSGGTVAIKMYNTSESPGREGFDRVR